MRICIVYSCTNNKKIEEYARSLGKGIEKQSNAVIDLINIDKESDKRLTGYNYILFGCGKSSLFSSKLDKTFLQYLKNCGYITGKHTFAFTTGGFGSQKFLTRFMKAIESEGVLLKTSATITSKEQARIIGSKLHIK